MATARDVLEIAYKEVGTKESPMGSNKQKYGKAYGWNGVQWCMQFIWWLFDQAGANELFYGGKKTASCTTYMKYHRKQLQEVTDLEPGDIILYDWGRNDGYAYHVGILYETDGEKLLGVIEGNTSKTSDDNGGAVMLRKDRKMSQVVCIIRPLYEREVDEVPFTYEEFKEFMKRYNSELKKEEPQEWSKEARDWAEENGIIVGYPDGTMGYHLPLTREEYVMTEFRQNGGGK